MRVLLMLVCGVLAEAMARPSLYHGYVPAAYSPYYPHSLTSQYHAQDELGQYSYGYSGDTSAKHETKTLDGVTRGGYSYVDANGIVQTVNYVADDVFGFRVAATNLPKDPAPVVAAAAPAVVSQQVVVDTPAVAAAKAAHLATVQAASVQVAAPYIAAVQSVTAAPVVVSQPVVVDTSAVAAAKAAHLATVQTAAAQAAAAQAAAAQAAAPLPVTETPEVKLAKEEHLAAVEKAAAEAAAAPDYSEEVAAAPLAPVVSAAPVYSTAPLLASAHVTPVAAAPLAPVVSAAPVYSAASLLASAHVTPVTSAYYSAPLGGIAYAYGTGYQLPAARYSYIPVAAATSYSALTPLSSQYHAQDELGQYSYGYSGGPSAKHETKTLDGVTRGSYSYVDANGIVQTVNYVADDVFGFRVAATNLPVAPAAH